MESDNSSIISFGQLPVELTEIVINFIPYNLYQNHHKFVDIGIIFLKQKINTYIDRINKQIQLISGLVHYIIVI